MNKDGLLLPETWTIREQEGEAVWANPWATLSYKIRAPRYVLPDGSDEIVFEAEVQAKPGQLAEAYMKFGGEFDFPPEGSRVVVQRPTGRA